jgi:hypothetical protein
MKYINMYVNFVRICREVTLNFLKALYWQHLSQGNYGIDERRQLGQPVFEWSRTRDLQSTEKCQPLSINVYFLTQYPLT